MRKSWLATETKEEVTTSTPVKRKRTAQTSRASTKDARGRKPLKPLPPWLRTLLLRFGKFVLIVGTCIILFVAFDRYYLRANPNFRVLDERDVRIDTGSLIDADMLRDYLKIKSGMSIFEFMHDNNVEKFVGMSPVTKDIRVEYRMPNDLIISVLEREPVARVLDRFAVDKDGVVFSSRGLGALPKIIGFDTEASIQPGMKVPPIAQAAIRLAIKTNQPGYVFRVTTIDASNENYLSILFDDDKRPQLCARVAWKDMLLPTSDLALEKQLTSLNALYDKPSVQAVKTFHVMTTGRISCDY